MEKSVLVVRRDALFEGVGEFSGFVSEQKKLETIISNIRKNCFFTLRSKAEDDPSTKQVIPYCPIISADRVLLIKRKATQDEKRLHNLYSLGIGGHINPADGSEKDFDTLLKAALMRELNEELLLLCKFSIRLVGVLNDESNSVGAVHFGLVHTVKVENKNRIRIGESEQMSGEFIAIRELASFKDEMETWSKILYENISKWFPNT
ncbi:MAG: NUDIX domain-containing protein [Planctomycetota bacterium]|nr:NUDIX domain-containing protein [Planctomycetota bacterium]